MLQIMIDNSISVHKKLISYISQKNWDFKCQFFCQYCAAFVCVHVVCAFPSSCDSQLHFQLTLFPHFLWKDNPASTCHTPQGFWQIHILLYIYIRTVCLWQSKTGEERRRKRALKDVCSHSRLWSCVCVCVWSPVIRSLWRRKAPFNVLVSAASHHSDKHTSSPAAVPVISHQSSSPACPCPALPGNALYVS